MTSNRGLGSDNMSQEDKDKIHKMGGEASHNSGNTSNSNVTTNRSGGGRLDKEAQRKGGEHSHGNQNS